MEGKVFLATYPDGTTKVLGDGYISLNEPFVRGKWVDIEDPEVEQAQWSAWVAEEIVEHQKVSGGY